MEKQVRAIRNVFGDAAKPLWLSEVGFTTGGGGSHRFSEQQQADAIVATYRAVGQMPDVAALVFHTLVEPTWLGSSGEAGYGVVRADLTPKPAYCALGRELGRPGACP